jgi:hypothetical protein
MNRQTVNVAGMNVWEAVRLINKNTPCDVWIAEGHVLRNVTVALVDLEETGFYVQTEEEAEA